MDDQLDQLDQRDKRFLIMRTLLTHGAGLRMSADQTALEIDHPEFLEGVINYKDDLPIAMWGAAERFELRLQAFLDLESMRGGLEGYGPTKHLSTIAEIVRKTMHKRKVGERNKDPVVDELEKRYILQSSLRLRVCMEYKAGSLVSWNVVCIQIAERIINANINKKANQKPSANKSVEAWKNQLSSVRRTHLQMFCDTTTPWISASYENIQFLYDGQPRDIVVDWEPSETELNEVPKWKEKVRKL